MKLDEKTKFFKKLALGIGYGCDAITARDMYYAFVKIVVRDLKEHKNVRLPDFGDFKTFMRAPHKAYNIDKREMYMMPPHYMIKFKPHLKFKQYMNKDIEGYKKNNIK